MGYSAFDHGTRGNVAKLKQLVGAAARGAAGHALTVLTGMAHGYQAPSLT